MNREGRIHMNKRLLNTFSGGETSALMTIVLAEEFDKRYSERRLVFANTSQENDATLEFVHECEERFDLDIIWLEAVTHHGERVANTHKIVDYYTACRNGDVYEDHIKKYGIPNQKFQHCTRGLKLEPIKSYLRSIGWKPNTYDTAIGIRADEQRRRSKHAEKNHIVYPLMDWVPMSKPNVNAWWKEQDFRLELAGYQGNCKWCWKKSFRKLLTVVDDDKAIFEFPNRMEHLYKKVGPEFNKPGAEDFPDYKRTFFRGNMSTEDLFKMYSETEWDRAEDDSIIYEGLQMSLDFEADGGQCVESCEIDFDALSDE